VARVHPRVDSFATFGFAFGIWEKLDLRVKSLEDRLWEAVGQMKRDVLNRVGTLKVREVATRAPSGNAILLNGESCAFVDDANREIGVPSDLAHSFSPV